MGALIMFMVMPMIVVAIELRYMCIYVTNKGVVF